MLSSKGLKEIVTAARPIIERQLDDAEQIAAFRDKVSDAGGDWGALKALIKAQIQDERDETGEGKRVKKILDKAGFSTDYAELLGWSNMNENNFSADEPYDRQTGELNPKLAHTIVTGMQTEAGRAALVAAVDIMIDREEAQERNTPETASETPKQVYGDSVEVATAPPSQSVEIPAGGDEALKIDGSDEHCPADDNSPETADDVTRPAALAVPGGEPSIPSPDDGGVKMDGGSNRYPGRSDETVGIESTQSGQAVTTSKPAPSMDELRIANALILRPNCKRPGQETCGGQGRTHCRDCMAAPVERVREEA